MILDALTWNAREIGLVVFIIFSVLFGIAFAWSFGQAIDDGVDEIMDPVGTFIKNLPKDITFEIVRESSSPPSDAHTGPSALPEKVAECSSSPSSDGPRDKGEYLPE